jgi:hypothetical protein
VQRRVNGEAWKAGVLLGFVGVERFVPLPLFSAAGDGL